MPWIGGYGRKCVLTGVSRHRCQGEPAHPWYLEFRAPGVANARVNSGQRVSGMGASQHDMRTTRPHPSAMDTAEVLELSAELTVLLDWRGAAGSGWD